MAERAGFEHRTRMGILSPQWGRVNLKGKRPNSEAFFYWRRGRDSNPRTFVGYTLSKRAR